jgi:cytochrome oxidase Cu insertion factor (SCO1/SenC/PrrC family)
VKRGAFVPWLVALAVFGPFAAALLLYYVPADLGWLPRLPGSRELLEPPLAVPPAWLDAAPGEGRARYRWSLIYAKMATCDRPCSAALERLRQVHRALAGDADRVQRIFWYSGDAPDFPADRELALRRMDDAAGEAAVRALGAQRLEVGRVYVADPRGYLIVSYPAEVEQKELLRDLKRLLSASGSN